MNQTQSKEDAPILAGKWHLLDGEADETTIPDHRMDILFKIDSGHLRGAILNRNTGEEMPLASVSFDGSIVQLQMQAQPGTGQASVPVLVMCASNDKFTGHWKKSDGEILDVKLKLIRAKK